MRNHIPGEQITAARIDMGLTRDQLAAAIGVTNGAIYNWENDRCGIRKRHYITLTRLLRLGPEEETTNGNGSLPDDTEVELNQPILLDIPDYLFDALVEAADREFRTIENQALWYLQCCLEGGEE